MTHCTSKFYFEKHYSYFLFFLKQEKGVFLLCYWNDLNTVQLMFFLYRYVEILYVETSRYFLRLFPQCVLQKSIIVIKWYLFFGYMICCIKMLNRGHHESTYARASRINICVIIDKRETTR